MGRILGSDSVSVHAIVDLAHVRPLPSCFSANWDLLCCSGRLTIDDSATKVGFPGNACCSVGYSFQQATQLDRVRCCRLSTERAVQFVTENVELYSSFCDCGCHFRWNVVKQFHSFCRRVMGVDHLIPKSSKQM